MVQGHRCSTFREACYFSSLYFVQFTIYLVCRCNDGRRRAFLLTCAWLQAMPNMQQQGEVKLPWLLLTFEQLAACLVPFVGAANVVPHGTLENSSCVDMPLCALIAGNHHHRKALQPNMFLHFKSSMLKVSIILASISTCTSLQGHVRCDHCKGTGFRAGWMEPGCPA